MDEFEDWWTLEAGRCNNLIVLNIYLALYQTLKIVSTNPHNPMRCKLSSSPFHSLKKPKEREYKIHSEELVSWQVAEPELKQAQVWRVQALKHYIDVHWEPP